ncbi:MAG: lipid A deacylase LpxR family protein [Gammaproteobacteria bacterium]|nr:lipid A deacylase LpxR family protein [Gammaproteobacteria bacterium]
MATSTLRFLAGIMVLACASAVAHADSEDPWTFSVYFENDLFADTDQHYTNGLKLSWTSRDVTRYAEQLPDWLHPSVEKLPRGWRSESDQKQRNVTISLGQNIYTPQDIEAANVVEDDRPYAGWLYLGIGFQQRTRRQLDELEVQLGVIGPLALAEQTQTFVHQFRGLRKPRGWDKQLSTEPGIGLFYQRRWRFGQLPLWRRFGVDAIAHVGGAVGNVSTHAEAGLMTRLGWNLPADFGSSRIRPGGDVSAPLQSGRKRDFGIHAFFGIDGQAVLHDIFLDGNTFADSHSVDKRHLVGNAALGVSVVWSRFKLSAARVFRSREFRQQERSHRFGSITLTVFY